MLCSNRVNLLNSSRNYSIIPGIKIGESDLISLEVDEFLISFL